MQIEERRQSGAPAGRSELRERIAAWTLQWGPALGLSAAIFWLSSRPNFGEPYLVLAFLADLFGEKALAMRAFSSGLVAGDQRTRIPGVAPGHGFST